MQDAFRYMEIPCGFSDTSGRPQFGLVLWVSCLFSDGQALNPDDLLISMSCVLPMEFSWTLFFAQKVGEEAVNDVLPRVLLLRDRGRP